MKLLFVFLSALSISTTSYATSTEKSHIDLACERMLSSFSQGSETKKSLRSVSELRNAALLEEHTLSDILSPDFIRKHPAMLMSANQRAWAIVKYAGVSEQIHPEKGIGKVKVFSLFSEGHELAGGKRIMGHHDGIAAMMSVIKAAAEGDESGKAMPLLIGEPGTGKTVTGEIILEGFGNAALMVPEFYLYVTEWKDLDKIPNLKNVLIQTGHIQQGMDIQNFHAPMNDSPFAMLPRDLQNALIKEYGDEVVKLTGMRPRPKLEPSSQDRVIIDEITKLYGAHSVRDVLNALNKHIVVKRYLPGDTTNTFIIPAQSRDFNVASLFAEKNPYALSLSGPYTPFKYLLNGTHLRANGGVVFWDETLKYPIDLQAKQLTIIQSGIVQNDGAPGEPSDFVKISASNRKEFKEQPKDSALISRSNVIVWDWNTSPVLEAKTLLYGLSSLQMQKLGDPNAPVLNAAEHLDELIQDHKFGQKPVTSDGRYRIWVGEGEERVEISPHSMMFMAAVVTNTRQVFKVDGMEGEDGLAKKWPVLKFPMFTDSITRLKTRLGEATINDSKISEFFDLSAQLHEGSFGFGHREAGRWLRAAIEEAKKSENGHTVTPLLLERVLNRVMITEPMADLFKDSNELTPNEKGRMIKDAHKVAYGYILPKMSADVMGAIGSLSHDHAKTIYKNTILSLKALYADPGASDFFDKSTGTRQAINKRELESIAKAYLETTGQTLSIEEIDRWHSDLILNSLGNDQPTDNYHTGLMSAIMKHLAIDVMTSERTKLIHLVNVALKKTPGTPEEALLADSVMANLKNNLGYNEKSLLEVLQFAGEAELRKQN